MSGTRDDRRECGVRAVAEHDPRLRIAMIRAADRVICLGFYRSDPQSASRWRPTRHNNRLTPAGALLQLHARDLGDDLKTRAERSRWTFVATSDGERTTTGTTAKAAEMRTAIRSSAA